MFLKLRIDFFSVIKKNVIADSYLWVRFYPYLLEKVDRDFFIVSYSRISLLGILYHPSFTCVM
nr:MAG TPA: hypothetical protein [Caudoviricetes sp.]